MDGRGLAMHDRLGPDHLAAESLAQALVAQADPRMGSLPDSFSSTSSDTPAWSGVHGPGEMTMRAAPSALISSTVSASLRTTFTSCPNSPKYWTRL
jgi:hypothetical protein